MISHYKKCILDCSVKVVDGIIAQKHLALELHRNYEQLTHFYELLARHEMSMEDDSMFTSFILCDGIVRVHAEHMPLVTDNCELVQGTMRWGRTNMVNTHVIDARPVGCSTFKQILQWLDHGTPPLLPSFSTLPKHLERVLTDADFLGCVLVITRVRAYLTDIVLNADLPLGTWWSSVPVVWSHICKAMLPPPALELVFNEKLHTMFMQALVRDTDECLELCKSPWLRSTSSLHLSMFIAACDSPIARTDVLRELCQLIPKLALDILLARPERHDLAMECLSSYHGPTGPFLKTALSSGCATVPMVQQLLLTGCDPWKPMDTLSHCIPLITEVGVVKELLAAASNAYNLNTGLDVEIELYHMSDMAAQFPHTWDFIMGFFDNMRRLSSDQRSSLRIHFAFECLTALNAINAQLVDVVLSALTPAECNEVLNSLLSSFIHTSEDRMDLASELMHYMQQHRDMAGVCTNTKNMLMVAMRENRIKHPERDDLDTCMYLAKDMDAQALKYAATHGTMRMLYTVLAKFQPSTACLSAAVMHVIKTVPCTYANAWRIKALLETSFQTKGQGLLSFTAKAPKSLMYRLLVYDKHCLLTEAMCRAFHSDKELYTVGMPVSAIHGLAPVIGGLNGGCMAYRTAHRYARLIMGRNPAAATLMCKLGGVQSSNIWLIKLCVSRGAVLDDGMLREAIRAQDVDVAEYIVKEGKLCVSPQTFCLSLLRPDQLPMADMLQTHGNQLLESESVKAHFKHHDDPFIPYLFHTFLLRQQAQ